MLLRYYPFTLLFKHPFVIAHGTRNSTPVVFTELEHNGHIGYGEASMPPYLGESHETAIVFLKKAAEELKNISEPDNIEEILKHIDSIEANNCAAKASVDIALHDLIGKIKGAPCYHMFGLKKQDAPYTSYTIGMDTPDIIAEKIKDAEEYKILKVKLGGNKDEEIIDTVRRYTNKPLSVDVNQGWKSKEYALDMIHQLAEKNVLFIEQPLNKNKIDDAAWLTEKSPLPVIADEAVQRLSDVEKLKGVYSGINIKLMKCTGMHEAHKMILRARELNMKVLIGCMSETSCGISAAAQLSPLCDWADLDGPLLIKNNCFKGISFVGGKIQLSEMPGIGATPEKNTYK